MPPCLLAVGCRRCVEGYPWSSTTSRNVAIRCDIRDQVISQICLDLAAWLPPDHPCSSPSKTGHLIKARFFQGGSVMHCPLQTMSRCSGTRRSSGTGRQAASDFLRTGLVKRAHFSRYVDIITECSEETSNTFAVANTNNRL